MCEGEATELNVFNSIIKNFLIFPHMFHVKHVVCVQSQVVIYVEMSTAVSKRRE